MRIGFDMLAVQSPHHGHRGIGRYSRNLVSALLARDDGHEFVLYAHRDLPVERIPAAEHACVRTIAPDPVAGESTVSHAVDRLARLNPDGLDVLVILSPFEFWASYCPPARPLSGLRLAAVVYDMIPFLFQEENGEYNSSLMRYYRILEDLRRYDALLAISDSTRRDTQTLLGLPEGQIVNISAASDGEFFRPDVSGTTSELSRHILARLGVTRPYVLNVGGLDFRKNSWRLIDAFARLPESVRARHQLVMTFSIGPGYIDEVYAYARRAGLREGDLVLTNEVTDDQLLLLYQRCSAFVFPSMYEGFGLPLLEAMQCGAPVIGGNNSSQIEVVGDAGLLVNDSDTADITAKIARLLEDRGLARDLRERALAHSAQFRWERTAQLALDAVSRPAGEAPTASRRADRPHRGRPRIAYFSPLPPRKSGVSDYSAFLLGELGKHYEIDLYHDTGYVPEPGLRSDQFRCCDAKLFQRNLAARDYRATLYQMGNSPYHHFMYETMLRIPGIVTLHDFFLAGFHLHYGHRIGFERDLIRNELLRDHPEQSAEIESVLAKGTWDREAIARGCARRGWFLNRRIIERAQRVIVHSPWGREQVRGAYPGLVDRVEVIPHGIWPRRFTPEERAEIRSRFGLPADALLVASFGFVHPDKMNPQALDAFRQVADQAPGALFLFVGEDASGGSVPGHAVALGLGDRVRFLGRQPLEAFADLIGVTDVGVNLRLPPTHGETSGALLYLLASGVPTIVTDVGSFSDYPSDVVRKVRWESEGPEGLTAALRALVTDPAAREALGRAAWDHVVAHHDWAKVALQYVALIERSAREREDGGAGLGRLTTPHLGRVRGSALAAAMRPAP